MRPLKLKIEGLKSISAPQSIDFEKLSQNGIFGIFGKTGSGKSTILDAIVLAIYGEVVENLKFGDFINIGCDCAKVELDFSVKRGGETEIYKAERAYKYNKARTSVTSAAKLSKRIGGAEKEEYVCIAEKSDAVSNLLKKEIIGLEKSDFLKCIALPQGDFAAFLKMTRTERLSVIGKLFDLTKYGEELAQKVKEREKELTLENERLSGRLEALVCSDEQTIKNDELLLKQLDDETKKLKGEQEVAEKEAATAKTFGDLLKERNEKSELLNQKSAYRSIIEEKRKKLKLFESVKAVKQTLNSYDKTLNEKKQTEENLKTLREQKQKAEKVLSEAKTQKESLPFVGEKIVELKVKLQAAAGLKAKNAELEIKKQKREELKNEYLRIKSERDEKEKLKLVFENRIAEIKAAIEETDVDGVIEKLKGGLASAVKSDFCKNEIDFLQKALNGLSAENLSESAVYGLIAAHIEGLKGEMSGGAEPADKLIGAAADAIKKASVLSGELLKVKSAFEQNKAEIGVLDKKAELVTEEGVKVRAEYDAISEEIRSALNGKSYEEAVKAYNAELAENEALEKRINENFEKANEKLNAVKNDESAQSAIDGKLELLIAEASKTLQSELHPLGLSVEKAREVLSYDEAEQDEILIKNFDDSVKTLENRIGELNSKIAEYDEKYRDYGFYGQKLADLKKNIEEINKKVGELSVKHKNDLEKSRERCIIVEKTKAISRKRDLVGELYSIVKAGKFMEFIADEYLKEIAGEAETRVLELTSGRYGLVYDGNFLVTDNFAGGIRRPVAGLSGGETFIVSLSLALALSKQISAKALRPIDFFFLDEGFGTLDEDLVDDVCDSLEKLRMANFTVGLITHVTELKNRIASKLYVHGATAVKGTEIESVY